MEVQDETRALLDRHFAELELEQEQSVWSLYDQEIKKAKVETEEDAAKVVQAFAELDAEEKRVMAQYDARLARVREKRQTLNFIFLTALERWTSSFL